jgi:regulatory protein
MQVTGIKTQINKSGRFSIFIDGKYIFSLSEVALLDSKLIVGQQLTATELEKFKQQSADDLLYQKAFTYAALRMRTEWEVKNYIKTHNGSGEVISHTLNKLRDLNIIDDEKYARVYIEDRQNLHPSSRRKLVLELQKRHIASDVIKRSTTDEVETTDEHAALHAIITKMRKQTRYSDNLKLMQYLSRQGFSYNDIKAALNNADDTK